MKYIVLALLLMGCSHSAPNFSNIDKSYSAIDSLISKNQRNIDSVSVQLTQTDSVVSQKIDNTVKKIDHLETENKQLKEENNALKTELNNTKRTSKPYRLLPVSPN